MKEQCVIDFVKGEVRFGETAEGMKPKPERLLRCIVTNRGLTLTWERIAEWVWGEEPHNEHDVSSLLYRAKKLYPPLKDWITGKRGADGPRYTFHLPPDVRVILTEEDMTEEERRPAALPSSPVTAGQTAAPDPEENVVQAFYDLWEKARGSGAETAPAAWKTLTDYVRKHAEPLKFALPTAVDKTPHFPASQCVSPEGEPPLFLARLLLEDAKALSVRPAPKNDLTSRAERDLLAAVRQAERAAHIALERGEGELIWLRGQGEGEGPVADLLRAEAQLLQARCHVKLAELDEEDKEWSLFQAQEALAEGQSALAEAWERGGKVPTELDKTAQALTAALGPLAGAPAVKREKHRLCPQTKLVFNTVYDSAKAQTGARKELIKTQTMQMAATPGMRSVLQLPQLLDNAYVVGTLLHDPGFQALCRKEIIVLSSYGDILDPKKYILDSLAKENFRFSASPLLNDWGIRRIIAHGLSEELPFREISSGLPWAAREELEPLYEGYRLSYWTFNPRSIGRYHQVLAPNYGGRLTKGPQMELPEMVDDRLRRLTEDEGRFPVPGRKEWLTQLEQVQKAARKAQVKIRSDYKTLFQTLEREERWETELLRLADELVDVCYGYSGGYRSTDCILHATADKDALLCVHAPAAQAAADPTGVVSYAMKFAARQAEEGCQSQRLDFDNILELALIARRLNEEEGGKASPERLQSETGISYTTDAAGQAVAAEFCVSGEKELLHITPGAGEGYQVEVNEKGMAPA